METGGSLTAPESVRKLQTVLHAKAKGSPDFRFYSLSDKVWRADVLEAACKRSAAMAGQPGWMARRCRALRRKGWKHKWTFKSAESHRIAPGTILTQSSLVRPWLYAG